MSTQMSIFDAPVQVEAAQAAPIIFTDLPRAEVREKFHDEMHHARTFIGMKKIRQAIARAGLNSSVATEMHILHWIHTEGMSPAAMCDFSGELIDVWIEQYLHRTKETA